MQEVIVLDPGDLKEIRETPEISRGYYLMAQMDPDSLVYWPVWVLPGTPANIHIVTGFIGNRTESRSSRMPGKVDTIRIVPYLLSEDLGNVTARIKDSIKFISITSYGWIEYFLVISPEEVLLLDKNGDCLEGSAVAASSDVEYAYLRRQLRREFGKVIEFYGETEEECRFLSQAMGMSINDFLIGEKIVSNRETELSRAKPHRNSQGIIRAAEDSDNLSEEQITRQVLEALRIEEDHSKLDVPKDTDKQSGTE